MPDHIFGDDGSSLDQLQEESTAPKPKESNLVKEGTTIYDDLTS